MKLYSGLYHIFNPLDRFYPEAEKLVVKNPEQITDSGILILHGGSDIHPSLYGRNNEHSHVGLAPSPRDQSELKLYLRAKALGIPILGICRGAQLACAMEGGILVQDVDGHGGGHRIQLDDGSITFTSSIHHQMMYPWTVDHQLIGWSQIPRGTQYRGLTEDELAAWPKKEYEGEHGEAEGVIEPEIVWFPKSKCLAVQGHPEMMDSACDFNKHLKRLLDAYCFAH